MANKVVYLGLVFHIYNPNPREVEVGESEVQSHCELYRQLKVIMDAVQPCLKNKQQPHKT